MPLQWSPVVHAFASSQTTLEGLGVLAHFPVVVTQAVCSQGPSPAVLQVTKNLGTAYWFARRFDRSVPILQDVVERLRRVLGADDPRLERLRGLA